MSETSKFRLSTAVDRAWDEFLGLKEEERAPISLLLLADKYSPKSIRDCLDVLEEHKEIFTLDTQPGWLLKHSVIATVGNYLFRLLMQKDQEYQQEKAAQVTRNLVVGSPIEVQERLRDARRLRR